MKGECWCALLARLISSLLMGASRGSASGIVRSLLTSMAIAMRKEAALPPRLKKPRGFRAAFSVRTTCVRESPLSAHIYEHELARRWYALPVGVHLPLSDGETCQLLFTGRPGS